MPCDTEDSIVRCSVENALLLMQQLMQQLQQTVIFLHYCKRLHEEKSVFAGKTKQI